MNDYFPKVFELDEEEDSLYPNTMYNYFGINTCRSNGKSAYLDYLKKRMLNNQYGYKPLNGYYFKIDKVIFNDPATIVIWADGSKTVVKCQEGDTFNKEMGLAMAISKRALGDKGNYCEIFKKWIPEIEEPKLIETEVFFDDTDDSPIAKSVKAFKNLEKAFQEFNNKYTYCKDCKNVDQYNEEEVRNCRKCRNYSRFERRK